MSYSSNILSSSMSGIITIEVPTYDGKGGLVTGILQDDPQIGFGNNFSPISEISSALDTLQELEQVIATENITNYVPASGMAWKGTKHITLNTSFYLISYNADSNIQGQAKLLAELCAIKEEGAISSKVHGGYHLDYYSTSGNSAVLNNDKYGLFNDNTKNGTVTVHINDSTIIKGLLCQSFSCQPSTVVCRNYEPLYYNITMTFIGRRAPVTTDLSSMFGGRK